MPPRRGIAWRRPPSPPPSSQPQGEGEATALTAAAVAAKRVALGGLRQDTTGLRPTQPAMTDTGTRGTQGAAAAAAAQAHAVAALPAQAAFQSGAAGLLTPW